MSDSVELEHLREVNRKAGALVQVLDMIEANDSFKGIWSFLWAHGYNYNGPNWTEELKSLRETLRGGR